MLESQLIIMYVKIKEFSFLNMFVFWRFKFFFIVSWLVFFMRLRRNLFYELSFFYYECQRVVRFGVSLGFLLQGVDE